MNHFIFLPLVYFLGTANCDITDDLIADSVECRQDFLAIKDQCKFSDHLKGNEGNNWLVLECLQNPPGQTKLSEQCDHYLWRFKLQITQGGFIEHAEKMCKEEINQLRLCEQDRNSAPGHFLSCLVENKHNTKNIGCRKFLERVETLIFGDFRLVSNFMNACQADVDKLNCGRTGQSENDPHSQGRTIACLEEKVTEVGDECKQQILQIAEMQAESVTLDRALVMACKEDMSRFCSSLLEVPSSDQIYDCLMVNKMNEEMSTECRKEVSRRQKLVNVDYKVSNTLIKACKVDIKENRCRKDLDKNMNVGLNQILVCLEDARLQGSTISGSCSREMSEYRRALMEDFSVSPELVKDCFYDVSQYCPNAGKSGKTIHCLMQLSMDKDPDKLLSPKCDKTLMEFLRDTESDADWNVDPVLESACEEVVAAACDPKAGPDGVLSCLMENLARDSKAMTGECRQVLLQIHYFLSREILVDHDLYKSCRSDAKRLCGSSDGWHVKEGDPSAKLVFPCLVRNLYNEDEEDENDEMDETESETLSDTCSEQVERVLRQRAISVKLFPEVEEVCRDFLHMHCTAHTGPGEEMVCLQDNLHLLTPSCKEEVVKFTEMEAKNPYLHPIIFMACQSVIDENCGLEDKARNGQGVLQCLERYMLEHPPGSQDPMNPKCATIVEKWEIMTLEDFRFSFEFKTACGSEIKEHCKSKTKKYDLVHCLVALVVNDTVLDQPHRVNKDCRDELKFELLQKHGNLKLNPLLASACGSDLDRLCPGKQGMDAVECLKDHKPRRLSPECRKTLHGDEEEEAVNNEVDVPLMRNCKKEIKSHCSNANASSIIDCLAQFAEDFEFDQKCLNIIKRRITQHNQDYRLNTDLAKACKMDIKKYCQSILQENQEYFEGKVLFCLKEKYSQNINLLAKGCSRQIQKMVRESPLASADPQVEEKCPKSMEKCIIGVHKGSGSQEEGVVVEQECLFKMLATGSLLDGEECANVLSVLAESQNRDVKSDRMLFKACSLDLAKFCRDVQSGDGKRFACLVAVTKDSNLRLEPRCQKIVESRVSMYRVALKVHPMEQALELYNSVMESPHRNYIVSSLFIFLSIIFVFGLCFGRVTNRMRNEIKNR